MALFDNDFLEVTIKVSDYLFRVLRVQDLIIFRIHKDGGDIGFDRLVEINFKRVILFGLQIEFEGLNSKGDEQLRCIDSVFGEAKDR
jgi:hypothetical protein